MTASPQPPETPTPRTDADNRSYPLPKHLQLIQFEGSTCGVIAPEEYEELYNLACAKDVELALLKRANGEMRETLQLCSNTFWKLLPEPEDEDTRYGACCVAIDKALSSTPATQPSPSIPMDVAEKMYEALQFLITQVHTKHEADSGYTICPVCIALTAAEKHGLGKRKYNLK